MVFRVEFLLLLLLLSMFTRSPTTLFRFGTNVVLFWFKLLFYSRDDFICLNSVIHEKIGWMCSFFSSTIWCLDAFVCMSRFVLTRALQEVVYFSFFSFKLFFFALWCICFHLGVFFFKYLPLSLWNRWIFNISVWVAFVYFRLAHLLSVFFGTHRFFWFFSTLAHTLSDWFHTHTYNKHQIN